jgi:energy-coupling factor transport system ATP-binding protein
LENSVSDPVIALREVGFSYDKGRPVLKGLSLFVSRGERVAVLGRNGSGKSTLVKILGALLTPSQGTCFARGRVSLVFQNPENQIVGAVVEDDVAFAPENQGVEPIEIERRVVWALEKVGLLHKKKALSSALSGGEKQRLALAGALAAIGPGVSACLVLDEPTAMLDPQGRAEVESVLRELHAAGTTIVQVTHQIENVTLADRVLVLSQGEWIWQGDREAFWDAAESLGFSLPPLVSLRRRLVAKGITVNANSIDDLAETIAAFFSSLGTEEGERLCPDVLPLSFFQVRDLGCGFGAGTPVETRVLTNVSCAVPAGKWFSILGRTGSGKSTLVQHLNGLYPIQSGEISILSEGEFVPLPKKGTELRNLRRRVGLVFQSPEDQLFSPTLREELTFAPLNWGLSKEKADAAAARAVELVGLGREYLERSPLRLSGGERRLAAIASVLSADPECLVLDEPTAGLDAVYRSQVVELLSRLKGEGRTIVTVTHDFEMAFEWSDRVFVIEGGRGLFEGSVASALSALLERESENVMLPEVLRLCGRLKRQGLCVPLTWDVDGLFEALHESTRLS